MPDIGSKLLRVFDITEDALGTVPRITLTGDSRVMIENHRGLAVYEREHIAVNGGRLLVSLHGEDLELMEMNKNEIVISGRVFSLELE